MGSVGKAHGKLLLFGEHSAVYGHPAVGVSLPEQTTVRLDDCGGPGWDLDAVPATDREAVSRVIARMESSMAGMSSGRNRAVRIESAIPRSLGFGSSAALCVAFARALLQGPAETSDRLGDRRVWALAHDAEHLFHGRPSGVDTGISLMGGLCILRPVPAGLPEHTAVPARGLHLVVGAVRRDEACAALIGGLASRMKAGDPVVRAGIDHLAEVTRYAARLLTSGGKDMPKYLGTLADAAMADLRSLGLSTPDLESVLEAALRAGGLGGKLSGAGGGGAFYAVAPDETAAGVIARKIEEAAASNGITMPGRVRVVAV